MSVDTRQPKTILIVDDEPDMLTVLGALVESLGNYKAEYASDGYTAAYLILKNEYDLILLDIMMPGIDGIEVCKTLREHPKTKQVPIIMVSALHDLEVVLESRESGADDYLIKPFDSKVLIEKINRLINPGASDTPQASAKPAAPVEKKKDSQQACEPLAKHDAHAIAETSDKAPAPVSGKTVGGKEKSLREQIFTKIKETAFLPIMPETLLTMKRNASKNANELKEPISSDIGFTYNNLQVANSAFYSPKQPVTNISWAITVIGSQTIMENVRSMIQNRQLVSEPMRTHLGNGFLKTYLSRAYAARFIAEREAAVSPDDAYSAMLLRDAGTFFIMNFFHEQYQPVLDECTDGAWSVIDLEKKHLGLTRYDVGYVLMRKGTMPLMFKDFLSYFISEKRNQASDALKLYHLSQIADWCGSLLGFSYAQTPVLPDLPGCLDAYPRFFEYVQKLFSQVIQQVEYTMQMLDLSDGTPTSEPYQRHRCILIGDRERITPVRVLLEFLGLQVMLVPWDRLEEIDDIQCRCIIADTATYRPHTMEKFKGRSWNTPGVIIEYPKRKDVSVHELFPKCTRRSYPVLRRDIISDIDAVLRAK